MAVKFLMPHSSVRLVEPERLASRDWLPYLGGIETLGRYTTAAGALTDLAGGATLAQVITQVNALTAALRGE